MRPIPTSRLAVSSTSCSPPERHHRLDDDDRVGREEEGQPQPAILPGLRRAPDGRMPRPWRCGSPDHWLWDFWFARDGDDVHVFYLQAPRSLGDPELRHHNATIGHAVSRDLRTLGGAARRARRRGRPVRSTTSRRGPAASLRHDGALAPVLHRHRARRGRRRCSGSAARSPTTC